MKKAKATVDSLVKEISERLDNLEQMMWCSIRADSRFKVGNRVRFSAYAKRRNISTGTKGGVQQGIVEAVDSYFVRVRLDGYKDAHSYFHGFFELGAMRPTRPKKGANERDEM